MTFRSLSLKKKNGWPVARLNKPNRKACPAQRTMMQSYNLTIDVTSSVNVGTLGLSGEGGGKKNTPKFSCLVCIFPVDMISLMVQPTFLAKPGKTVCGIFYKNASKFAFAWVEHHVAQMFTAAVDEFHPLSSPATSRVLPLRAAESKLAATSKAKSTRCFYDVLLQYPVPRGIF